jgi:putative transcriptional regulator
MAAPRQADGVPAGRSGKDFQPVIERRMKKSICFFLGVVPALALLCGTAFAADPQKSAQTYFLVAQPDLEDPMFSQSVVLMLPPTGTDLIVGLIVNKPTRVKLTDLFPNDAALKQHPTTAYFGGPVDITAPLMLIHANHAPDDAVPLLSDIYLDLKARSMLRVLKDSKSLPSMRLYLGRAQWTKDQLHDEMLENSWYKVPSDPEDVFSADADTVWRNLVARAQAIETSAPGPSQIGAQPMLLRVSWPSPALDETVPDR